MAKVVLVQTRMILPLFSVRSEKTNSANVGFYASRWAMMKRATLKMQGNL